MKDRKKEEPNRRNIALQNLEKANEAKRAKRNQPKLDDWETRSRTRLERIIEKAERELTKASTMEGVDIAKLTNALKVCHQAHRTLKDTGNGSLTYFLSASEGQEHLQKTIDTLAASFKRCRLAGRSGPERPCLPLSWKL